MPPANEFFYLDHDQRVTFASGSEINFPWRTWGSVNVVYGSGFVRGDGPEHMPHHKTVDISLGKDIGENYPFVLPC
jgi:hypothetical protein